MDALLDASGSGSTSSRERSAASKTPGLSTRSSKTPGSAKKKKPHSENELHHDRKDGALQEQLEHENPRVQNARTVRGILEQVYPRWQELVKTEGEKTGRTRGLERFDCGMSRLRLVQLSFCVIIWLTLRAPNRACSDSRCLQRLVRSRRAEGVSIRARSS